MFMVVTLFLIMRIEVEEVLRPLSDVEYGQYLPAQWRFLSTLHLSSAKLHLTNAFTVNPHTFTGSSNGV